MDTPRRPSGLGTGSETSVLDNPTTTEGIGERVLDQPGVEEPSLGTSDTRIPAPGSDIPDPTNGAPGATGIGGGIGSGAGGISGGSIGRGGLGGGGLGD